MPAITVNGASVLEGTMALPRVGRWWADLVVDTKNAGDVTGACTLNLNGVTFAGASFRLAAYKLVTKIRLVAGANGLGKVLAAKAYRNVSFKLVLQELLQACGEKLSTAADPATLGGLMPFWQREAGPGGGALLALLKAAPVSWRFLPDGSLWLGAESWPVSKVVGNASVMGWEPHLGRIEVSDYTPNVFPGEFFSTPRSSASGNVSYVQHRFDAQKLRSWLWTE